MSDTCIVCLGDLSIANGEVDGVNVTDAKSPRPHHASIKTEHLDATLDASLKAAIQQSTELIANIIPCNHVLHNECLTPWRERANSCPICRASFHMVELKETVGGPTISSYAVEDRQQVADLDPTMFLDFAQDEEEDKPCLHCGEDDNEDVLMICDGCECSAHTYCVGLQEVPYGAWFCDDCRSRRAYNPHPSTAARISRGTQTSRRRTRGQQRRQRSIQVGQDQSWNAVWQSVWSRINLDLDFPYEDDDTSASYIRRHRQHTLVDSRSAQEAWRTRLRVAELQGAGNRFREAEPDPTGLARYARSPIDRAQDPEEALAWNAFDAARSSPEPSSARRSKKRKSPSPTPQQTQAETAHVPKRRRTSASTTPAPAPTRGRRTTRPISPVPRQPLLLDSSGPSFLQSLLQEVEDSSNSTSTILNPAPQRPNRAAGSPAATEHGSPRPSSPAGSPLPSNHSSPRAMSPSPPPGHRSGSPSTLSSSIQPIYPLTERGSSPPPRERVNTDHRPASKRTTSDPSVILPAPRPRPRAPATLDPTASHIPPLKGHSRTITPIQTANHSHVGPSEASPNRATMSLAAKSDIQKLVSSALKPLYNDATITKDEYTVINRDVSRMLYDRIGDFDTLQDDQRLKWEKVAGEEVCRAVVALKANA